MESMYYLSMHQTPISKHGTPIIASDYNNVFTANKTLTLALSQRERGL
jgi:hypothetical protein